MYASLFTYLFRPCSVSRQMEGYFRAGSELSNPFIGFLSLYLKRLAAPGDFAGLL